MTEAGMLSALAGRFPAPAYAFFTHVPNATGGRASRTADGLAMSLWPSRGLLLLGFEVKVSKQDWRREYLNPAKTEEGLYRFCDHWWMAAPKGIVDRQQLPPTWGLLELDDKGRWHKTIEAPKLTPEAVTRHFLASLMRQLHEQAMQGDHIRDARTKGIEEGRALNQDAVESARAREQEVRKAVEEFEAASGVSIGRWDAGRIGAAVRLVLDDRHRHALMKLETVKRELQQALTSVTVALETAERETAAIV